jgi:hypothetical protein
MWKSWKGDQVKGKTEAALNKAIHSTLETVGSASDQQVPHDEGDLQRSKFIKVQNGEGVISYGGGAGTGHPVIPYAKRHHEKEANFQKGRKNKYLSDPFNQIAPRAYQDSLKTNLQETY